MKKNLFLLLMFAFFSACVISCSKDDSDEKITLTGKSFVAQGSTLTYTLWGTTYNYTPFYMYRFTSASSYEYSVRENGPYGRISSTEFGSYTLNYPNITLKKASTGETTTGSFVDKNTLRIGLYEYALQ